MKIRLLLASLALPAVIAGCASFPGTTTDLDELQKVTPTGSAFTQALTKEYTAFAQSERDQYDWMNSWYFARKGMKTAKGEAVVPELVSDWWIRDDKAKAELESAHDRLVKVLATNAPTRVPALTATAQVKYDCWVEQQDEGWQTEDIASCRSDFLAAMNAIEAQGKETKPVAAKPAAAKAFLVFFDFNKAQLTTEARRIITDVAKAAREANYPKMTTTGYTDLAGPGPYNMRLSIRRAEAVRRALVAAGVPTDHISVEGRGKSDPLVKTPDGVREPQNRRVAIKFD